MPDVVSLWKSLVVLLRSHAYLSKHMKVRKLLARDFERHKDISGLKNVFDIHIVFYQGYECKVGRQNVQ